MSLYKAWDNCSQSTPQLPIPAPQFPTTDPRQPIPDYRSPTMHFHRGKEIIAIEQQALQGVAESLGEEFDRAITLLLQCRGKVILIGVGKSGIIAKKITATLNSTGTPSCSLHPSDALHGDVGVVQDGDVVIILSKSGESPELLQLLPMLHGRPLSMIAITSNPTSRVARAAAAVLSCAVEREACSYDIAPTASTTAMLALGDALAVVLYEQKGFTRDGFALTHPGGSIGKRLLLKLQDLMATGDAVPTVGKQAKVDEILIEISRKRMGATLVVEQGKLLGIITDGDLRRALERKADLYAMRAADLMTTTPLTAPPDMLGTAGLMLLESGQQRRTQLPVVSRHGKVLGIVHLHDLIDAGLK